jgi:hypothetical protein
MRDTSGILGDREARPSGRPQPSGHPVSECLLTILNEEWEHGRIGNTIQCVFAPFRLACLQRSAAT